MKTEPTPDVNEGFFRPQGVLIHVRPNEASIEMSRKRIYLAGPIGGLTFEGCSAWRERVISALAPYPVDCFSPLRGKRYLRDCGTLVNNRRYPQALSTPKGINRRDRLDVKHSDLVLVNLLDARQPSLGTVKEMGWAEAYDVPVVLVMEPEGNVHEHVMLDEGALYRCATLESGIALTLAYLFPDTGTVEVHYGK